MSSADPQPTPTSVTPRTTRPSRIDAALSGLTTTLLVVCLAAVGWGVLGPSGPDTPQVVPSEPVRLRIPSLDISAAVVPISLGTDAVLDPPEDAAEVGWWDGSALPGATDGRVVITGHTLEQGDGALDDIVGLGKRRQILLTTSEGTRRYQVTDRLVVDYDTVAKRAQAIFGQTEESPDGARLILVTCTDFNGSFYESNVIIVAEPVAESAVGSAAGRG